MNLADFIRDVPDFPKPGIIFKDIAPLLRDPAAFAEAVAQMKKAAPPCDAVAALESRGFLFGAPLALALGKPFVPVRKAGKLPGALHAESYALEYGDATIEIQRDAIPSGARVLIVDDVLATGGTAAAAARLVERAGGVAAGFVFLLELQFLHGRERLDLTPAVSLLQY